MLTPGPLPAYSNLEFIQQSITNSVPLVIATLDVHIRTNFMDQFRGGGSDKGTTTSTTANAANDEETRSSQ